jgi:uncharacterized protein (TIGR03435 family)
MLHNLVGVLIVGAFCAGSPGRAQTPATATNPLKFEVASLKPSQADPAVRGGGIRPAPGGQRYIGTNATLRLFITVAYGVKGDQIEGGPDWMDTARFDMNGVAAKQSNIDELHSMLQDLLADRFKLRFHRETKQLPVYALTVDKDGPKLHARESANAGEPWVDVTAERMLQMTLRSKVVTMDYFAFRLSQLLDRPVINLTKLPGSFDFDLKYTREAPPGLPENAMINGQPVDTSGPTIFEAVRRQLGLKLESQKGPVQIIVVDHAEKPAEN